MENSSGGLSVNASLKISSLQKVCLLSALRNSLYPGKKNDLSVKKEHIFTLPKWIMFSLFWVLSFFLEGKMVSQATLLV